MVLSEIKKNLQLYLKLFKFSFIVSTVYRIEFVIEIFVELGYIWGFFNFFNVLYGHIDSIAGWSKSEIFLLLGLNIISIQVIQGISWVYNLRVLPEKIKNGEIDFFLLKPMPDMQLLTAFQIYFSSIISAIPGLILVIMALKNLHLEYSILKICAFLIIFFCGLIINYCINVLAASLSFKFISANSLPRLSVGALDQFAANPHVIYKGASKVFFYLVLPVVFIASIPADTLISSVNWAFLIMAILLSICIFIFTTLFWKKMISYYSSASS